MFVACTVGANRGGDILQQLLDWVRDLGNTYIRMKNRAVSACAVSANIQSDVDMVDLLPRHQHTLKAETSAKALSYNSAVIDVLGLAPVLPQRGSVKKGRGIVWMRFLASIGNAIKYVVLNAFGVLDGNPNDLNQT